MPLRLPRGPAALTPLPETRLHALAGQPLATFGRRAAALAIDFAIAAGSFLAIVLPSMFGLDKLGLFDHDIHLKFTFFENWYSIVWLVLYFSLALYWGKGRTPGKRLMKIRVVSLAHEHLSFWHCVERALSYGASALEAGFGFFQYFIHPYRQTVHDRIAETVVLDERPAR